MKKESINGVRHYTHPETGELAPSVTAVMDSAGVSRGLMYWAAKRAAEYAMQNDDWRTMPDEEALKRIAGAAFRHSHRAAAKGTDGHSYAEDRLLGRPVLDEELMPDHPDDVNIRRNVDALLDGKLRTAKPVAIETSVWSDDPLYAGTFDGILKWRRKLWLIDWKTNKRVEGKMAIQLAAYRYAEQLEVAGQMQEMPAVDGCLVLHVPKEGVGDVYEMPADRHAFEVFMGYLRSYLFERSAAWKAMK